MPHEQGGAASAVPTSEEDALFIDLLHEAPLSGHHRKPRSIVSGALYCILLAGYVVVSVSAPWISCFPTIGILRLRQPGCVLPHHCAKSPRSRCESRARMWCLGWWS